MQPARPYKYLDAVTVLFVVVLLVSNVVAVKAVRLFGFVEVDCGNLLFPISYIFGDVLVEVYGYARSRRVIWMGFLANALAAGVFAAASALPAAPGWDMQAAFATILGQTPRIVAASLAAFWCGEFVNAYVMARMKVKTGGRHLWARTISSTAVGQGVDTVLFQVLAFAFVWPTELLLSVIFWNYVTKVAYEAAATPVTYAVVRALKRSENADHYDRGTDFNPFALRA